MAIILVLTVNYTWVPYVPPNGIITILILFSSYMIFPNAFSVRIVPPLILSIGNLALQWRLTEPVGMFSLVTMLVALVMVNVLGIIFSSLLDKHRLAEFKARQEEKKVREELNRLATIDDLTGVYNRRKLIQIATEEFERSKSGNLPFSVLMIDLDHFKQLNDSYGHETGDRVLSAFAAYVASRIPDKAIWGRLGGEEFVLCLLDCPSVQAKHIAESIRQGLAIKSILPQSESVRFSISIGVTEARVQDKSFGDVLKRADKALYRAKRNGRNRTEVFQSSSRGTG